MVSHAHALVKRVMADHFNLKWPALPEELQYPKGVLNERGHVVHSRALDWAETMAVCALNFGFYPKSAVVAQALAEATKPGGFGKQRMEALLKGNWKHVVALLQQPLPWGYGPNSLDGRAPNFHQVVEACQVVYLAGDQAGSALRTITHSLWVAEGRNLSPDKARGRTPHLHEVASLLAGVEKDAWPLVWKFRASPEAIERAIKVASRWNRVRSKGGTLEMPLAELWELSQVRMTGSAFQMEASRWAVDPDSKEVGEDVEEGIRRWEERWNLRVPEAERSIPRFNPVVNGDYQVEILPVDDPRGLFLGQYTNCCQHPTGAGSTSAWHGALDKDGRFLVITHCERIVAQAWVWRGSDALVLDNIEALGGQESGLKRYHPLLTEAVAQWGEPVKLGTGYTKLDGVKLRKAPTTPTPKDVYTDASCQVWLVKR